MKPLTHCPYCKAAIQRPTLQGRLYQELCAGRCKNLYAQYYNESFDEPEIAYCSFYTKHFSANVHFKDRLFPYVTNIYSLQELHKNGVASPILRIPTSRINIYDLDALDKKLSSLVYFA